MRSLSIVVVLLGSPAWAMMPPIWPAISAGPVISGKSSLVLERADLTLRCEEVRGQPSCRFELRWRLHNPSPAREEQVAAFYGFATRDVTVTVDGTPAGRTVDAALARALDESFLPARERTPPGNVAMRDMVFALAGIRGRDRARAAFDLSVAPGGHREVRVTGTIDPGSNLGWTRALHAAVSRHLITGAHPVGGTFVLDTLLWPRAAFEKTPLAVEVQYPAHWKVDVPAGVCTRGAEAVVRCTATGGMAEPLRLSFDQPTPTFWRGGPLVGIGATVDHGFRLRAGYEVAAPAWLLHSLQVDTDLRDRVVVAPVFEAVTPTLLFMPMALGAGVGLPVRLHPGTEVGVRFQGSMSLGPIALVASFDYFPAVEASSSERFRTSLFLQVSF
jgi:hypothetical protein